MYPSANSLYLKKFLLGFGILTVQFTHNREMVESAPIDYPIQRELQFLKMRTVFASWGNCKE